MAKKQQKRGRALVRSVFDGVLRRKRCWRSVYLSTKNDYMTWRIVPVPATRRTMTGKEKPRIVIPSHHIWRTCPRCRSIKMVDVCD